MASSSWLTTPAAVHRADEVDRSRVVTAGLSPAYLAYALAQQEQHRQLAVEMACSQLEAAQTEARRGPVRQIGAALTTWLHHPRVGRTRQAYRQAMTEAETAKATLHDAIKI
jgi:hypothetical protein